MPKRHNLRIALDTGGTFNDCVWLEGGRLRILKVFSTPADPSHAIQQAVAAVPGSGAGFVLLHGTTVGTNTLLQRKGARVAFITTRGFEDTLEIGRQARPELYNFFFDRPEPLVPAALRFGIAERVDPSGHTIQAPAKRDLRRLAAALQAAKPDAIAISLLFSFANAENERTVAAALASLKKPLSVSHQVLPEFREFERASTVVVNAYLQPVMTRYLEKLEARLSRQGRASIFVMQSSGGITALKSAAREPVRTVLSGPAGGVVGASALAARSGFQRIVTFDMGGTSTDVALVDGALATTSEAMVAGLPVHVPMLNIHTIGAGGGSIARFDAAGALRVGPESAGADPGPICYGRGIEPTVSDANLLLGRLRPEHFLGGDFRLDPERTRRLVFAWLKQKKSAMSVEQFAAGVVRVVNANMEKAVRVVSIERGHDPREFALVAFGGAGGLHACELAEALSIPQVIIPANPGALSALGILLSDVVKDSSRTVLWRVSGTPPHARLNAEFQNLEQQATQEFQREGWRGRLNFRRSADLRYQGQGYELNVAAGPRMLSVFHQQHEQRYGYSIAGRDVEIVTLRLRAWQNSGIGEHLGGEIPAEQAASRFERAQVYFSGNPLATAIIARSSLRQGKSLRGPAIITEYSATTVVPPGMRLQSDRAGNLIIEVQKRMAGAQAPARKTWNVFL